MKRSRAVNKMLIDTHAHLFFEHFDKDLDEVVRQAFKANVKKIINIGIDLETCKRSIKLAESYPGLFAAVGIHPNDSTGLDDKTLLELKELARHPKVVAIGEIGLDFYRDRSSVETQKKTFRLQINLAKEMHLPIVIHNRQAGREILAVLKSEGVEGLTGVFHCFSEDTKFANEILELGFYVSFTGNVTYKKSELPAVVQMVPLSRLLLETDCPFLAPEPKRGRRNEPAHVVYIAQKLAEIKNIELSEIEKITTANAVRLFGIEHGEM